MQAKIEWYQEVLELEPGSKVFFPLAKLLGQSGRGDEAIKVLRLGLERHPEYAEARLLLVELLRESGEASACAAELDMLSGMFSAYPGFWEAWAERNPADDASLAFRFLAAFFRKPALTVRDILVSGLSAFGGGGSTSLPEARIASQPSSPVSVPGAEVAPVVAELTASLQQPVQQPEPVSVLVETGEHSDDAEEPSLRTRSMAEVLAQQGDVEGALEIYNEILSRTPPGDEAETLKERIAALKGAAMASPAQPEPEESPEEDKVRNMLENLAQRLDARAQE